MEFQIVRSQSSGFQRLSEMFHLCLGRKVDENYFVWKYLKNPSGTVCGFEALHGDNIAAFYGVIPEKYVWGQTHFLAYQSMDTMTHPGYQKRGLFVKLAKHTYSHLESQCADLLIVGVPGSNSFPGFVNKLNWKHIADIQYLFVTRFVFLCRNINRRLGSITTSYVSKFDNEEQAFLDHFYLGVKQIRPFYDVATLNWKTFEHPFKKFKILRVRRDGVMEGIVIFSLEGNKAKIELADFLEHVPTTEMLYASIRRIFADHAEIQQIYTWMPSRGDLLTAYPKLGFLKNPFSKGPFSYRIPFIVYGNKLAAYPTNELKKLFDFQPLIQD